MSSSGRRRLGSPATRKLKKRYPRTFTEKKSALPATKTLQVWRGLPRASRSVEMAKTMATATATQMDQVVPCSETYFMFSEVTLKYEGTSQKAVSPSARTCLQIH